VVAVSLPQNPKTPTSEFLISFKNDNGRLQTEQDACYE
jgi:hypothetical protein